MGILMKNGIPYASGSEIPQGGTQGQVLKKASNLDGDFEWGNVGSGGGNANFDIGTVPLGGAGVYEVNAILNNNDSERVRATYSRGVNGELPDWFSMSVTSGLGTDDFEVSTRGYTEQKAAQAQNNAQTYADLKLTQKQDKLVSGTNIKTINGQHVVGSGDLILHQGVGDGLDLNDMPSYNQLEQMINSNALLYIDGNWLVTGLELESTTAQVIGEYADKVRRYYFDTGYDLDAPLIYGGTYTEEYSMNPNMVVNADISQPYGEFTTGDGETFRFWGLDQRIGIDFKDKRGRQQRRNYDMGVHFEVGAEKWYGTYRVDGVTYQVYSKLLDIGPLPSAAGVTNYPHGITGIKQILQINGFTNDGFVMNAPRQTAADNISIYQAQKSGNIAIEVGKDRSNKNGFVMMIYAKNN